MKLSIFRKKIYLIMVAFLFFATVNSEENAISSNEHEFNFYSGMFDFSDDGKRSTVFGIQHQNETLVRDSFLGTLSPISGILITFFGGLTLYFDNKIFFYMKPTIINLLFAAVLFFGKYFTQKPLLKIFFQNTLNLEDEGWKKLNYRWVGFFLLIAILNEIVWRTQSEVVWVNFKVWGLLPISFLFAASQVSLINKYKLK